MIRRKVVKGIILDGRVELTRTILFCASGQPALTTQLRLVQATRSLAIASLAELLSPGHASQIMNNGFFGL